MMVLTPKNVMFRFRISLLQTLFKIGVLKNFANFTGKHLFWSLFLIKLQVSCRSAISIIKLQSNFIEITLRHEACNSRNFLEQLLYKTTPVAAFES